jgi:septum formation protein|tara:strand:- start:415 stop:975 length:561 start_codon:yes stop_codon:yes gene_type:complete
MKLVLASRSPRRKSLLEEAGYEVYVDVSDFDEKSIVIPDVKELVVELALKKAEVVAPRHQGSVIVAADTLVCFEGKEIGQQDSDEDARKVIKMLLGKTHEVFTGVCIVGKDGQKYQDLVRSEVTLKNVSDAVVEEYIKSGQYKRKAGAYNIADPEFENFVEKIEGSETNIVGLPIEKVKEMLEKLE